MAKVSVKLGFTFRVGDLQTNQYGRVDLSVHRKIGSRLSGAELPLDQQLDDAKRTAEGVWEFV